jgi:uncharacterized membrane protein
MYCAVLRKTLSTILVAASAFALCLLLALVILLDGTVHAQGVVPAAVGTATQVEVQGTLETLVVKQPQGWVTQYVLNTGNGRVELRSPSGEPISIATGTRVTVKGSVVGNQLLLDSVASAGPSSKETTGVQALSSGNTFGNQATLVLLLNFQDDMAQPFTPAQAQQIVFQQVNAFYQENSQNQTSITGSVRGYYTLPINASACTLTNVAQLGDAAATHDGIDVSQYVHVLYLISESTCGYTVASTLGGPRGWINSDFEMQVVANVFGYNLGLRHSNALNCSPDILGNSCTVIESGDLFDVMGNTTGSHFNAYQKERLGYLNYGTSQKITAVSMPGTYDITPYEDTSSPTAVKALKIFRNQDSSSGTNYYFYIEYRQPLGFDAALQQTYPSVFGGVLIHFASDNPANSGDLLDMNPQTAGVFNDAALPFGNSFTDSVGGVIITAKSGDANAAHVQVQFTGQSCVPAVPTISVLPATQTGLAGAKLSYNVTVTNADTSACNQATFALTDSVPSGWTASLQPASLTLAPGATGTATIAVTSPVNTSPGAYSFYVRATSNNSGYQNFVQVAYVIPTGLTLSAAPTSVTVPQAGSGTVILTTAVNSGFSAAVILSAAGLPNGMTASFSPSTIAAPGAGQSTLTLSASAATAMGGYSVTVSAMGGTVTTQVVLAVTVGTGGDFSLSAVPAQIVANVGTSAGTAITSTAISPFNAAVQLSVSGLPSNVTGVFLPSSIATGAGTSTLTLTAGAAASPGVYSFTVSGTSGSVTHTITLQLTVVAVVAIPQTGWKVKYVDSQETNCGLYVGAFAIDGKPNTFWQTSSCIGTAPLPHEIQIDLGAVYNLAGVRYLPRQDGKTLGNIKAFEVYVSNDGMTWGTAVATGNLITQSTDSTEKQIIFSAAVNGRYVRLRALSEVNGMQVTSAAEINVLQTSSVPANDFTLSPNPASVTVVQGAAATTTIASTLSGSFSSSVALTISGLPSGVTASFQPTTIAAPGSGNSTLTFTASASAATGTSNVTVTGTAGSTVHTTMVALTVNSSGGQKPIAQTGWKLKYVDSQELNCAFDAAVYAFDGKPATFWQTSSCIGTSPLPHEIQIDLGATYTIAGFRYLPRQDGKTLGNIKAFEIYVSTDGVTWGTAVATGNLITQTSDSTEKQVLFSASVTGRYVRLRALSEVGGTQVTNIAELNVLQK